MDWKTMTDLVKLAYYQLTFQFRKSAILIQSLNDKCKTCPFKGEECPLLQTRKKEYFYITTFYLMITLFVVRYLDIIETQHYWIVGGTLLGIMIVLYIILRREEKCVMDQTLVM